MTRRFAVLVGALVAAASLTSCSSFDRQDAVAAVGDEELTLDELTAVLESPLAGATGPLQVGNADIARNVLEVWVMNTIITEADLLGDYDADVVRAQLAAELGAQFTDSSAEVQNLLIVNTAISLAAQSGEIVEADAVEAITTTDVWISSRYGAWDSETRSVIPYNG